ncbi:MAG: aldo/keto reductase [Armatimonadota bacterium]
MIFRTLGQSDIKASVIGLGTWAIGGWAWGGTAKNESEKAIHAAIDAGINLIDTAPAYGLGLSEEIVGNAIEGKRDKVILATKCGLVWHTDKGQFFFNEGGFPVHRYLGPESIRYEVEESLRRLRTDYIDLYQTHWQDPSTPIEDTMAALLELKDEGKIKTIGVSNATTADIDRYMGVGSVDSAQELFSMLDRKIEDKLVPYCINNGISILAYSPLALGLLTGKIDPDRVFPSDDFRSGNPRFSAESRLKVAAMMDEIRPVAEARGLTIAQLVIAWTIAQPGITFALCGARNPAQAIENAGAGDVTLSAEELAIINDAISSHLTDMP